MSKKYSFIEFVAAYENDDFNNHKEMETNLSWAKNYLKSFDFNDIHHGDCTKSAHTCDLCTIEDFLKEYREYYFNKI